MIRADATGTSETLTFASCCGEPNHITWVLVGFSRSQLAFNHASMSTTHAVIRRTAASASPAGDNCRAAKRRARKLEWGCKHWKSDYACSVWLQSLRDLHKLVDRHRSDYWCGKIESARSARELWEIVQPTSTPRVQRMISPTSLSWKRRQNAQPLMAHHHPHSWIYSHSLCCTCSSLSGLATSPIALIATRLLLIACRLLKLGLECETACVR